MLPEKFDFVVDLIQKVQKSGSDELMTTLKTNGDFYKLVECGVTATYLFNRRLQLFLYIATGIGSQRCSVRVGPVIEDRTYLTPLASQLIQECSESLAKTITSGVMSDLEVWARHADMGFDNAAKKMMQKAFGFHSWCLLHDGTRFANNRDKLHQKLMSSTSSQFTTIAKEYVTTPSDMPSSGDIFISERAKCASKVVSQYDAENPGL